MKYPHDITLIDVKLEGKDDFAAAYLMQHAGKAAFIESGTTHAVPSFMHALKQHRLTPEDVLYVMPTHVHLDHAGGAGRLMELCPNAKLVIHPRGAFHMKDPSKLLAGAEGVYGKERVAETYGELVPVDEDRIIEAEDNYLLDFNGRELLFMDTPGHAKHHYCIYDKVSNGIFSGDTFGLSYREFDTEDDILIFPTTTPVQFDPHALKASIERIASLNPERIFLTHYGMIQDVQPCVKRLHDLIDALVSIARQYQHSSNRTKEISRDMLKCFKGAAQQTGTELPEKELEALLAHDIALNTAGLEVWLDYQHRN